MPDHNPVSASASGLECIVAAETVLSMVDGPAGVLVIHGHRLEPSHRQSRVRLAEPVQRGLCFFPQEHPGGVPVEWRPGILTDWNDLRFFLSVARLGSLSASSRSLRVDPATVGRRISNLEASMGLRFFERRADGYRLTDTGLKLLDHAQRVEDDLLGMSRALEAEDRKVSGPVAITASESVTLPFLIPTLPSLRERYPGIRLDLVSSNKVLSLARREADLAVRMVRPEEGDLLARKIATMGYGLYASDGYIQRAGAPAALSDLREHALIDWLEDYPRAATTVWYREAAASAAVVRMTGSQERLQAGVAGIGIVCLPYIMVRGTGLRRVLPDFQVPPMELWLMVHPDTARVRRVRAVIDFIAAAATAASAAFSEPA